MAQQTLQQSNTAANVYVNITHSHLRAQFREIKLDKHMTIANLKLKLLTMVGTSPPNMLIRLQDESGHIMCQLADDSKPLGFYSPFDGCTLHVVDTDPRSLVNQGWIEDLTKVEKYVMSDADYDKRHNTFRRFKQERMLELQQQQQQQQGGDRSGEALAESSGSADSVQAAAAPSEEWIQQLAAAAERGARCTAEPGARKGHLRYVGPIEGRAPGAWVGVDLDEPLGKHDGTAGGHRYFQGKQGHGIFVRPPQVSLTCDSEEDGLASDDEI